MPFWSIPSPLPCTTPNSRARARARCRSAARGPSGPRPARMPRTSSWIDGRPAGSDGVKLTDTAGRPRRASGAGRISPRSQRHPHRLGLDDPAPAPGPSAPPCPAGPCRAPAPPCPGAARSRRRAASRVALLGDPVLLALDPLAHPVGEARERARGLRSRDARRCSCRASHSPPGGLDELAQLAQTVPAQLQLLLPQGELLQVGRSGASRAGPSPRPGAPAPARPASGAARRAASPARTRRCARR